MNAILKQKSLELAVMDALENGLPMSKVSEYVLSDECVKSAQKYFDMLKAEFL